MTSYKYSYKYLKNGETYNNTYALRTAIQAEENKRFGPEPVNKDDHEAQKAERLTFWAGHGVEYSEEEIPEPTVEEKLEEIREQMLNRLEVEFNRYRASKTTYMTSSLGFKANANETAFNNVVGLVGLCAVKEFAPNGTVTFRDFDNADHELNADQLTVLKNEISASASAAYVEKWQYTSTINTEADIEKLKAMTFTFTPSDFSNITYAE